MRLLLVLPLALLLAGCAENLASMEGDLQTRGPYELGFRPVVALPMEGDGARGFEPSVAADGEGNVYVTAARGVSLANPAASWLWVSHDGGATFEHVEPLEGTQLSNLPVGAEGHVDVSPEGTAYFIDLTHLATVPVARSTDGGASWELRTPSAAYEPVGDRPWVAAGPDDLVVVGWNQIPTGSWVYVSTDGGRTFPTQTLLPGTHQGAGVTGGEGWAYAAVPAVGPDGTIYLGRGEAAGPAVYRSTDGGKTFERALAWETGSRPGYIFTTVTVDAAGTVYVTTVEKVDGVTRVRYAYSTDGGASFSAPREVTSAAGTHVHAWSAAGAPGEYAVAFYENPAASGVPAESDGDWYVRVVLVEGADTAAPVRHEALATPGPVHRGIVCTEGLECESGRELADYLGVDLDPAGGVHVTWTRTLDGERTIHYARTAPTGT